MNPDLTPEEIEAHRQVAAASRAASRGGELHPPAKATAREVVAGAVEWYDHLAQRNKLDRWDTEERLACRAFRARGPLLPPRPVWWRPPRPCPASPRPAWAPSSPPIPEPSEGCAPSASPSRAA